MVWYIGTDFSLVRKGSSPLFPIEETIDMGCGLGHSPTQLLVDKAVVGNTFASSGTNFSPFSYWGHLACQFYGIGLQFWGMVMGNVTWHFFFKNKLDRMSTTYPAANLTPDLLDTFWKGGLSGSSLTDIQYQNIYNSGKTLSLFATPFGGYSSQGVIYYTEEAHCPRKAGYYTREDAMELERLYRHASSTQSSASLRALERKLDELGFRV